MQIKWRDKLIYIFLFLPISILIFAEISWLSFGIDIPYLDDWRGYMMHDMGSFKLTKLFAPANDTLYPVGKVLDALAYRVLQGNTIAYQFLSMLIVLGFLLLLQWQLLLVALKDRLLAASAFSFTLLMLQPATYWGMQNLAYHQVIPLVCNIFLIYLFINEKWHNHKLIVLLLPILGLLAGFSYISGAFSILILSILFLFFIKILKLGQARPLLIGCNLLLFVGIITIIAQLWVIIFWQGGTHRPDAPMAYPNQIDFWIYILAKVARSFLPSHTSPNLAIGLTSIALIFIMGFFYWSCASLVKKISPSWEESKPALIYISIFSIILIYLLLVGSGRANFHPPEITTFKELFSFNFYPWHYFWITLLWPWAIAILLHILQTYKINKSLIHKIAILFTILFILSVLYNDMLNHVKFYKSMREVRADGIKCLNREIRKGKEVNCPVLYPGPLKDGLLYGLLTNASFTRTGILPAFKWPEGNTIFRLSEHKQDIKIQNAIILPSDESALKLKAENNDPQIYISSKEIEKCVVLDVLLSLRASQTDIAQVFFQTPKQRFFSGNANRTELIEASSDFKKVVFSIPSLSGFIGELRIDPISKPEAVEIKEIELVCRVQKNNA
ncbi:Uncharacterised protein [Legionella busanensis]|uniref:Transmembrane protein n=1 Tax=Legionella busanensis TaxID=190655 RepID=A0A378JNT9_9GAMM|nr:hypothetical protein [Legionella busanensis]STX52747.1 Uncharacterised protein [Legionella busanensis]